MGKSTIGMDNEACEGKQFPLCYDLPIKQIALIKQNSQIILCAFYPKQPCQIVLYWFEKDQKVDGKANKYLFIEGFIKLFKNSSVMYLLYCFMSIYYEFHIFLLYYSPIFKKNKNHPLCIFCNVLCL